jgi:hypothetical protein
MTKQSSSKLKIFLLLLGLGLVALLVWRLTQPITAANLLTNPDFASGDLSGWRVAQTGLGQATAQQVDQQTLLALEIPDTAAGSWSGVGQRLPVSPLQRYRLKVDYRLPDAGQHSARLILRVTQFDKTGRAIKTAEFSNPEPLGSGQPNGQLTWASQQQIFVTGERAAEVEVGLGLAGLQATRLQLDNAVLELYPTSLGRLSQDGLAVVSLVVLLGLVIYGLGRLLWPFRRQLLVNTGLAIASLGVTLLLVEIAVRYIPINLISPNWPTGYHIPYIDGKSYRLSANYPATYVADNEGDQHLVMSNSVGVRDVEIPEVPNQSLVLVLGDSMTFGWAVSDINNTWTRRLDAEVAGLRPETNYHFVNAGVSGYNTFQEVYLFEALVNDMTQKGLKPKVALLSFFSGIWERNLYGSQGRFSILNGAIMYTSVRRALLELAGRLVDQSQIDDLKLIGASRLNHPHQFLITHSRLYFILSLLLVNQVDENWDAYPAAGDDPQATNYEAIRLFKEVAVANGIQPVVAYLPADNLFAPDKLAKNQELVGELAQICDRLELSFINPYGNMKKLGINGQNAKEKLTLIYNRHYSAAGNALYAKALAPLLADLLGQQSASK